MCLFGKTVCHGRYGRSEMYNREILVYHPAEGLVLPVNEHHAQSSRHIIEYAVVARFVEVQAINILHIVLVETLYRHQRVGNVQEHFCVVVFFLRQRCHSQGFAQIHVKRGREIGFVIFHHRRPSAKRMVNCKAEPSGAYPQVKALYFISAYRHFFILLNSLYVYLR